MTADGIINMAQQAGYPHVGLRWNDQELSFLERFGALAVAADRAMRAAQPVVAQQPGAAYAALPEPYCNAHDDADACYPDMFSEHQMRAFADATCALRASHGQAPSQAAPSAVAGPVAVLKFERGTPGRENEMPRVVSCNWMPDGEYEVYLAAAPTAQPAPQQDAQEPVAVVVPCYTPSGKRVALYSAKQDLPIGTQLYTAPQPAHSGKPVATVIKRGASRDWMSERLGGLPDGVYSLYLAPQPVGREPLSDEEVDSLCKVGPVYAPDGKVTRTPPQYRDELEAAQRYGLRKGERAHGIKKGGQHVGKLD